MLQKFILVIATLALSLNAANNVVERDNTDVNLLEGGKATDMSYGYYIKNFQKTSMKAFENVDLSQYPDKRLLVGYGVYDVNEQNCRYLDVPSNSSIDVDFENLTVLGNRTYAVSRNKVTFSDCKALAAQYSGYVYTPKNGSSYGSVLKQINNTSGGSTARDLWVGYSRPSCSDEYVNDEGFQQSYNPFSFKNEICTPYNLYTYSPAGMQSWLREGGNELHYCPIEIQSPDYLRPVKYCAPWWRVERSWKLQEADTLVRINGRDYDFRYMNYIFDYPKDFTTCTKYDNNITLPSKRYQYTCNSYDDIKASPGCIASITLPQCHVNECVGYVENVCTKIDSFEPFKNYDVGYILIDGVETKVKTKDNKIINVYDCPPPKPKDSSCTEKSTVTVLPVECPNSQCAELAACLQSDTNSSQECFDSFRCEKTYGSVDSPHINSNGVVDGFNGICIDGNNSTTVVAYFEKKSEIKRKCLEFDKYYETNTTVKKCVSETLSTEYAVSTAITQKDIYQDNPQCIRINNIAEARPTSQEVISFKTKGFFKTAIERSFIDGSTSTNELNSSSYLLSASSLKLTSTGDSLGTSAVATDSAETFCNNTFPMTWFEKRFVPLHDQSIIGIVYNKNATGNRNAVLSSSVLSGSVGDSYGQTFNANGWSVALFDTNYKITSFNTFGTDDIALENYLSSLADASIVAIIAQGDPSVNIPINTTLISEMALFGASSAFIEGLTASSSYILFGAKNTGKTFEQSSIGSISKTLAFTVTVPPVLAVSTTANCAANKTTLAMSDALPAYSDYNFTDIGITESNVNNQDYCFIGGDQMTGDSYVSSIINNTGIEFIYNIEPSLKSNCDKYVQCLGGEQKSFCSISVSQETVTGETVEIPTVEPSDTTIVESQGSFLSDFSYKDIYSIQEYTEGNFGYVSNYYFKPPLNNVILINGKEVSPIVQQTPIPYILSYDSDSFEHAEKTKNETPTNSSAGYSALDLSLAVGGGGAFLGTANLLFYPISSIVVGPELIALAPAAVVYLILQKENKWGWYNSSYNLYQNRRADTKYFENIYGYDPRILKDFKIEWDYFSSQSGTLPWNSSVGYKNLMISSRDDKYKNFGFSDNSILRIKNSVETTSIRIDKDGDLDTGDKWWELNYKVSYELRGSVSIDDLTKDVNVIYMGAVNMLSVVVPFTGDYEVIAYDKNNNILGSMVVQEQNFVENTTTSSGNIAQYYAKVQLALADNFNIASGQDGSKTNGSCLASDFTEWGGGVSGAYYEQGVPDLGEGNNNCSKSNDYYVQEHSATKITVRPVGDVAVYTINLKKPMPFPNRIILVNLKKVETRKYECFDLLTPCDVIQP